MTASRLDGLYVGLAALAAVGAGLLIRRLCRRDPDQAERRRRERVGRIGRLTQCEIVDILEGEPDRPPATRGFRLASLFPASPAPEPAPRRSLVVYRYTISGVDYETTQDVPESSVGDWLPVPGQVASIKYDPANPSNSILMSRSWPAGKTGPSTPAGPEKGK